MTNLVSYREKINRINLTRKLDKMQEEVNELYEKEGATDKVIEKQLEINEIRHKENIPDTTELIYKNFVQ